MPSGLQWVDNVSPGSSVSYARITDTKNVGYHGGYPPGGKHAWSLRDLNTISTNNPTRVQLGTNCFTLQPGKYIINASAPSCRARNNQIRLRELNTNTFTYGSSEYSLSAATRSFVDVYLDISSTMSYEIQHFVREDRYVYILGIASGTSSSSVEIYTIVNIIIL